MVQKALVLLAEGFEEVEAITPIDYLRRAGVAVTTCAISGASRDDTTLTVQGSHGIAVNADASMKELVTTLRFQAAHWDAVLLPGGMPGASNLAAAADVTALLREMASADKLVCAICAAPAVVLAPHGLLSGRRFTCYPGMEATVHGAQWSDERVVIDRTIITSRGAGTAADWALAIIETLLDKEAATTLAAKALLR
jgi:4-methyl-5(b-hydroxyethyl)-thiazole monophosphate biosynthesis